jgi:predicted membrane-bound mannosyltransferase
LVASRVPVSPRPGFASRRDATTWTRRRPAMGSLFPSACLTPETCGAEVFFCRFLAFYTVVLTALYATLTYKTPWCLLSFLMAMILLAGVGAWAILRWLPGWPAKTVAALLLVAGAAHLGRESYQLNFRFFADHRNPYVYAHASSDVLDLAQQMERLAQVSPDGHNLVIHVVTPENYWPLPWYLRQFNRDHIGYWQDVRAWRDDTRQHPPPPVIILAAEVQAEVDANLRAGYNQQMMYGLRPGVLLRVYVREDLWQAFIAAVAR